MFQCDGIPVTANNMKYTNNLLSYNQFKPLALKWMNLDSFMDITFHEKVDILTHLSEDKNCTLYYKLGMHWT